MGRPSFGSAFSSPILASRVGYPIFYIRVPDTEAQNATFCKKYLSPAFIFV
jgi:hypothetical protein